MAIVTLQQKPINRVRYSAGGGGSWQLAANHYETRKQNMRIVCPRPDSETGVTSSDTMAKAAHSLAYPGRKYRMPIGVSFGSWPMRFELITGPSGMYVGQYFGDVDYGYIVWPTAVAGSYTVTLRVYDQEYQRSTNPSAYAEVTYTLNCSASLFVVLQQGTSVATFADIVKTTNADSTYVNKAVWIRGGSSVTYNVTSADGSNELQLNNKPKIWITDPDEAVTMDFSSAQISLGNYNQAWFDFDNVINLCQTLDNAHAIFFYGSVQDRCGVTIRSASAIRRGAVANDNPAVVTLFAPSGPRVDFYARCTDYSDFSAPFIDCYGVGGLIEETYGHNNVWSSGGLAQIIFPKGGNVDLCVRRIKGRNLTTNGINGNSIYLLGSYNPVAQRNIEVSWCDIRLDDSSQGAILTNNAGAEGTIDLQRNIWITRNNVYGAIDQNNTFYNQIYVSNNVVVSNNGAPILGSSGNRTVVPSGNVSGNTSAGILDANNLLTGASRTAYLGLAGCEVA